MADHYYAINPGEAFLYRTDKVTVGTSAASSVAIEVRVTDGACTAEQVYEALERLANYFATRNKAVVAVDTLTG